MLFISIICIIIAVALPTVKISPLLLTRVTSIILLYAGALSFNSLYSQGIGSGLGIYSGLFQVTFLSQSVETFIYIMAAIVIIPWASTNALPSSTGTGQSISEDSTTFTVTKFTMPRVSEYSLIILFTTLGASLLVSSSDLVSMYLSIELQSFAVYILATLYREDEGATSAGLKYFLLGGLSSCFILLGSGLIYSFTGLTQFDAIYSLLSVGSMTGENNVTLGALLGITIILTGFLFKIAAAPLHNWAPDVYNDVPTIITTWLTVMPKISIIIFLLEMVTSTGLNFSSISVTIPGLLTDESLSFNVIKNLLLISSLLSLIIGTVVGLAQSQVKRLLAYSTISHVGFLLLALAVNTEASISSLIFYLVQYSITNVNTFFLLLAFGYIMHKQGRTLDIKYINQFAGQFYANPLLSLSLAICLFSMAGIPPLLGFFAKQQVLYSSVQSGYYFISLVAILTSVISASYYLKIIKVLHFDKEGAQPESTQNSLVISNSHSFIIATLTLTILLFILKPSLLLNSTQLLALSIFTN